MSEYTVEVIDLTDTARLRVEVDDSPSNPRTDWDMLTGFVKIEGRGDSRLVDVEPVHDSPIPIADAWDRLAYLLQARFTPDEAHVERWARIFHGMHIEYDSEHGGFWFVDIPSWRKGWQAPDGEPTLEQQAKVIEDERETYRQWAESEVYGVILERAVTYARVERNERAGVWDLANPLTDEAIHQEWEAVDSLWGCYLDDEYTAQAVADEHFDLTPEEFVALGLPGTPLGKLAEHTLEDIRLAEEDVPLIDAAAGRLTPAGELYLREYVAQGEGEERIREASTGVSGEW